MRRFIAMWTVMALWTAMGCVADVSETVYADDPPALEEQQIRFDPSLFNFVTKIPAEGLEPGGYQEAQATLTITDTRYFIPPIYTCPIVVGMGVRTHTGAVSPQKAARITARVVTRASEVVHKRETWINVELCEAIMEGMRNFFKNDFGGLGARVHKPR